jgi:hypothetical protein
MGDGQIASKIILQKFAAILKQFCLLAKLHKAG